MTTHLTYILRLSDERSATVLSGVPSFLGGGGCTFTRKSEQTCFFAGHSLKHVQTNKCIHTSGYWPDPGNKMVLWSGCDEGRLEIWLVKQGKRFKETSTSRSH